MFYLHNKKGEPNLCKVSKRNFSSLRSCNKRNIDNIFDETRIERYQLTSKVATLATSPCLSFLSAKREVEDRCMYRFVSRGTQIILETVSTQVLWFLPTKTTRWRRKWPKKILLSIAHKINWKKRIFTDSHVACFAHVRVCAKVDWTFERYGKIFG